MCSSGIVCVMVRLICIYIFQSDGYIYLPIRWESAMCYFTQLNLNSSLHYNVEVMLLLSPAPLLQFMHVQCMSKKHCCMHGVMMGLGCTVLKLSAGGLCLHSCACNHRSQTSPSSHCCLRCPQRVRTTVHVVTDRQKPAKDYRQYYMYSHMYTLPYGHSSCTHTSHRKS